MQASHALIDLTKEVCPDLSSVDCFVADCGPGSFIGVRVAVTLAKSLAWSMGKSCSAVTSFDLVSPANVVAFPSKKGEYFVRSEGGIELMSEPPPKAVGFGPAYDIQTYPLAERAGNLWDRLESLEPALLLPNYVLEPSISIPKAPYIQA